MVRSAPWVGCTNDEKDLKIGMEVSKMRAAQPSALLMMVIAGFQGNGFREASILFSAVAERVVVEAEVPCLKVHNYSRQSWSGKKV